MNSSEKKLQLLFPRHSIGNAPYAPKLTPPIGALVLASYLGKKLSGWNVEVFDCNVASEEEVLERIDASVVGISVWFSNYENGLEIARKIKAQSCGTKIVFGGPHTNGLAERILANNNFIDFVVSGDGEEPLVKLLAGVSLDLVSGLSYRLQGGKIASNPRHLGINLDEIPIFDLTCLKTPFVWGGNNTPLDSMPVSGVRGCIRVSRCEYCSIPTLGVRTLSPEFFWEQILLLKEKYGIDSFFETGDIFPVHHALKLAQALDAMPEEKKLELKKISIKIYLYPGMAFPKNIENLKKIGVKTVFIGVENLLVWGQKKFARNYVESYTPNSLLQEIDELEKNGIGVHPSFVLGFPGETKESLQKNIAFIQEIASKKAVKAIVANPLYPLPGSKFFEWCLNNNGVQIKYRAATGKNLHKTDVIDYVLLSKLFIMEFSAVTYEEVCTAIKKINGPPLGNWYKDAIC